MAGAIGLVLLGLAFLALGGDSIVKAASGLAQRCGASPFVAGLLLVATRAPTPPARRTWRWATRSAATWPISA